MRLFLAIVPPLEVRSALERVQSSHKNSCPWRVGWTAPDHLHITVKFLGETPDAQVAPLCDALSAAELGQGFRLWLSNTFLLPPRGAPRIIAVGLDGDVAESARLAARVDAICHAMGYPLERRPFRPHITVGRIRDARSAQYSLGKSDPAVESIGFVASELVLFNSVLHRDAARYARVASFALRGNDSV